MDFRRWEIRAYAFHLKLKAIPQAISRLWQRRPFP
jgi:hypothetical protein